MSLESPDLMRDYVDARVDVIDAKVEAVDMKIDMTAQAIGSRLQSIESNTASMAVDMRRLVDDETRRDATHDLTAEQGRTRRQQVATTAALFSILGVLVAIFASVANV